MYKHVPARPEQVDEWTRIVIKAGEALLSFKVDSWQNGVTATSRGGGGRTTAELAKGGYQEFAFR